MTISKNLRVFCLVGFFAIMGTVFVFSYFDESDTPKINDIITTTDSVKLANSGAADYSNVQESVNLELNDKNYWTDENGKKHYTINVTDIPTIIQN